MAAQVKSKPDRQAETAKGTTQDARKEADDIKSFTANMPQWSKVLLSQEVTIQPDHYSDE